MSRIEPPLALLAVLGCESLDDRQVARLSPPYRAFAKLDYPDRRSVLAHVKRLMEVVPGLDESDCLSVLAQIGMLLNAQDNICYLGLESVSK